jgi:hypothetical protein
VESTGANIRRIGDRLLHGQLDQEGDGRGVTAIDGVEYFTAILGWSPDGERVAFYACPTDVSAPARLYAMNADGSTITRLSNAPAGRPVVCYTEAFPALSWAPDSRKLVYYSYDDPKGLYIVNADGTGARFLTDGLFPQWSPAGAVIAYVKDSVSDGTAWGLPFYAINADGTGIREVAGVPRDCTSWALVGCVAARPVWSPRGDLLAFSAVGTPPDVAHLSASPEHDVFTIKPDGSELAVLPGLPQNVPPGGGSLFAQWLDCDRGLPTAGCGVRVTNVGSQRLNVRREPGADKTVIAQVTANATLCLLGTPALVRGTQWWPVHAPDGHEGWSAVFDPDSPTTRWLQPTGDSCN